MKKTHSATKAVAAMCLVTICGLAVAAPRSEVLELDDKERAQLAKEVIKHKRTAGTDKGSSKDKSCGSVDIGNDEKDKKGSSRIAERERTVIVTGNVYNTANCRR